MTIKDDVIDIQALRKGGSIDGKPVYSRDTTTLNSYRNFVVSGEKNSEGQSYKSQVFGYVYNKNNGTDKGTRRSNAFSAGEVTAPDDPIFASDNQFTYKGDAFIGNTQGILKGTSEFNVNFGKKELEGDLRFKNIYLENWREYSNFAENIHLKGNIDKNTFTAEGKVGSGFFGSDVLANGQFYGESAAEMGGTFQVGTGILDGSKGSGSFGAIKQ